jgi:hypothetical protein
MAKPRTHFEQVPLQIIKKIIEGVIAPEPVNGRDPLTSKRKMEKDHRESQKQSKTSSRRSSRKEVSK